MNTKIILACHCSVDKDFDPIVTQYQDIFVPVLGGACYEKYMTLSNQMKFVLKDNVGDNISWANPLLCEITPVYWVYKNLNKLAYPDMVGLCHYRRIFDLDYYNLDPDTIYLKRCNCFIPEHHEIIGNYWCDPTIFTMVKDEYFNLFPQYYELSEYLKYDYTFYDKSMFIMNIKEFYRYMDYMTGCLRIIMNKIYPTVEQWDDQDTSDTTLYARYGRSLSYCFEYFAAMYFAMLHERRYNIQVASLTKGSSHDNYGHLCIPRRR